MKTTKTPFVCLASLIALFLLMEAASAQSLKPESPYPLQEKINKGTADSLVGIHYWYFFALPGSNRVTVRFKPMSLYGAVMNNNLLTVTISDEKRTWHTTKVISSNRGPGEVAFTAEKLDKKTKIIVSIAPPKQDLIRMGGDYEVEATGDVQFDEMKSDTDPVVRTYSPKVAFNSNDYGTTKFLADGTVVTANGFQGTWKVFDRENRIYLVVIENVRISVQYLPGYGLVKPDDPNSIVFQELRR